ncbi:MAG: hypothetical protein Q8K65_00085 [Alphaproteobacteria bacterium]|nr:hypothetical protein [Alphaproteobacteria bacterium]
MKPQQDSDARKGARPTSLAASFAKAARRRFSTVLLSAALISGCATTLDGQGPAQAATPSAQDTVTTVQQTPQPQQALAQTPADTLSAEEIRYRTEVRRILLRDAQARYPELSEAAQTGYSSQLKVLQDSLNSYLGRGDSSMHNAIVVLDPSKVDVAVALGMPVRRAIEQAATRDGRTLPDDMLQSAAPNAAMPHQSELGMPTYTQNPSAYPNMTEPEARPCLIIPVSDHALPFDVPGFTKAQKIEFTNTHEGWHCLDNRYRMTQAQMDALNENSPRNMRAILANPDLAIAASVIHHKEALADIAAAGDMIRRGHDPALIDHMIKWRQNEVGHDYMHYSVQGLNLLKTRIAEMGMEAFWQMGLPEARALYFEINDTTALKPAQITAMADYLLADAEGRTARREAAAAGSDAATGIAQALEILKPSMPQQMLRDIIAAFVPPDSVLIEKLKEWDPVTEMQTRAIERHGKITPETLIRTYGALQNELHGELHGADDKLAREKMTILKGIFTRYVRGVDYVGVNQKYGVDLEVAERDLLERGRAAEPEIFVGPRMPAPALQRTAEIPASSGKPLNAAAPACGCPHSPPRGPR